MDLILKCNIELSCVPTNTDQVDDFCDRILYETHSNFQSEMKHINFPPYLIPPFDSWYQSYRSAVQAATPTTASTSPTNTLVLRNTCCCAKYYWKLTLDCSVHGTIWIIKPNHYGNDVVEFLLCLFFPLHHRYYHFPTISFPSFGGTWVLEIFFLSFQTISRSVSRSTWVDSGAKVGLT